jgi:hypothetical protein
MLQLNCPSDDRTLAAVVDSLFLSLSLSLYLYLYVSTTNDTTPGSRSSDEEDDDSSVGYSVGSYCYCDQSVDPRPTNRPTVALQRCLSARPSVDDV